MKTKNQLIEEILRLDGERTQGEWAQAHRRVKGDGYYTQVYVKGGEAICNLTWYPKDKGIDEQGRRVIGTYREDNAAFIALAPQMASLIRDLKAQRDMAVEGQWQPIATAPRDGTQFIGFLRIKNEKTGQHYDRVTLTDWFEPAQNGNGDGFYFADHSGNMRWEPTHWMPLPTPPADDNGCA